MGEIGEGQRVGPLLRIATVIGSFKGVQDQGLVLDDGGFREAQTVSAAARLVLQDVDIGSLKLIADVVRFRKPGRSRLQTPPTHRTNAAPSLR